VTTIYDVARAAGVSPKTVSRVLNGDAPVNARTKELVEAAIAQLAYVPSNAARSMRSQRTGLVGMITGAISMTPGGFEPAGLPDIYIVQGAQRVFAEHGMTLLISDTGGQPNRVPALMQTFLEHRVEGLLHVTEYHQQVELPPNPRGTPMVLANCFDAAGTPAIVPDDAAGQFELVKGLIARGHRRIGYLALPERMVARQLRINGYSAAHEAAGLPVDQGLILTGALSDRLHEYDLLWDALDRLLALPNKPTAICCANDKMAMQVYAMLAERGLSVPRDISVVGYDDYRIITEHLHPTLTSVKLAYEAMGARAADRLLRIIANTTQPEQPVIERVAGPVTWRNSVADLRQVVTPFQMRRNDL
jgi:LacI family transcriptional regulator